ncbi:uracil-DNA glycosylase, putative [Entamoeba invadens IP1]|uniref:uracil-DNA glycosylase, putative n=1 Tax=Entamoeba invadens IP1 TaxID=370355 RepID=UPI0002C3DE27|nr:uracil-DNA glycosylase, putative [Entamoeba invadens IP1]ELP93198.1 uracil-DNA glycosylase, putative [Entamoeba invadens IP1]|eukprot:XP_004259969.1 uracil-DNA glycosylase, putative [Entamoeba invadens IP1]
MKRGVNEKQTDLMNFLKGKKNENTPKEEKGDEKKKIGKTYGSDDVYSHPLFKHLTEPGWREILKPIFQKYINSESVKTITESYTKGKIYPPIEEVFAAFNETPYDTLKVVLIGQDPYIKEKQAHGLCFSVNKGVAVPPSLKNIYKELKRTIPDFQIPKHGYLIEWARQGVLMLNATLTVIAGKSNSHEKLWKPITDDILQTIASQKTNLVYLLWGSFAQKKASCVDAKKNCCLKAPHPSPLAKGFDGNNHFVLCNEYLTAHNTTPIDWKITP